MKDDLSEIRSEILIYQTENGRTRIDVRLEDETVWLSQKLMAELFQKDVRTINEHIKNIYSEGELEPKATIRKFRIVRMEGRRQVARRRKRIFMKDWERKLDDFLRFNERQVLPHAGRVSKQSAEDHARAEYEKFSTRRRQYKEAIGEAETIKQLEKAAKLLPEKRKGRKK